MENKITEFEKELIHMIDDYVFDGASGVTESFIEQLRKIMPPVCGKEQRKFLDEVEEIGKLDNDGDIFELFDGESMTLNFEKKFASIFQKNFMVNFCKVIKGE
jgi:hypothetical protein